MLRMPTRSFKPKIIPDYITKKIPLLSAPIKPPCEKKRAIKAAIITGALVGLPITGLWNCTSSLYEFGEVITILPLIPVFLLIQLANDFFVPFISAAYPFVIITCIGMGVFTLVY